MPIFEFTCQKCSHSFEELLPSADLKANEVPCPACRSRQVKRTLSTFASNLGAGGSPGLGGGTGFGGGRGGCGSGGGFT